MKTRNRISFLFLLCVAVSGAKGARSAAPAFSPNSSLNVAQSPVAAPSEELPRGRVIEKVRAREDASQSYALYLPSSYTPARAWPILYCFDPLGRGHLPVERFREAAEKYGWIVVGSNNSRNGPLAPSFAAAQVMWNDTRARLSIDDRRLYAAGFSGGARQAVHVNNLCGNCLAGVIACGAGFPPQLKPSREERFAFYGIAGVDDFNFFELRLLDAELARLEFPHRLEIFEGAHQWAPVEVCTKAVEWMELQAMRAGRRVRDERFIEEQWKKLRERAEIGAAAGNVYEAYLAHRALAEDFAGLSDVTAHAARAAQLASSKEVRRAQAEEEGQIRRQQKLYAEILALREGQTNVEDSSLARLSFRRAVAALRDDANRKEDTSARRVARRTQRQLFAYFYETAANLRARGVESGRMVSHLETALEFSPDNPHLLFELAGAYAVNKERKKALATLRRATELGFRDADALATSEALASLREETAFKEILTSLRAKP